MPLELLTPGWAGKGACDGLVLQLKELSLEPVNVRAGSRLLRVRFQDFPPQTM